MKIKLVSFLFILIVSNSYAQSLEALKIVTNKLYEANYLMDFETVVSLTYPKVFEKTGKEVFLEHLDLEYQNDEYRLRLQLETVSFQFGIIKKIEGKSFCVITFRNPIRYFFETKLIAETVTEKKAWLQEINTTKEVTFEPNRNSFNVKKTSTYVAVIDENTSNEWKFFNFDDSTERELFGFFFNENTKKELGL